MGSRYEVEVKLASARGLKNVNWRHGSNRPYAVVWVDPKNKSSTRVDDAGDTEANWDQTLVIPLPPERIEDLTLCIDVVHAGSEEDTKPLIGSARLKLVEVLDSEGFGQRASRTLTVKRPSGRPHGRIDVKVTIRESGYRAQGAYHAPSYGVPPPPAASSREYGSQAYGSSYGAAPPQSSYGYGGAPAGYPSTAAPAYGSGYGGYNAPQQTASYGQGSYGYAPVEEKKKSKFGGMGTGLAVGAVAGVLGGIALVEGAEYVEDKIEDHVAEKVEEKIEDDREDAGYDDGGYEDRGDDGGYDDGGDDGGYDGDDF